MDCLKFLNTLILILAQLYEKLKNGIKINKGLEVVPYELAITMKSICINLYAIV